MQKLNVTREKLDKLLTDQTCKSFDNNGECGECRKCWDKGIKNISYLAH